MNLSLRVSALLVFFFCAAARLEAKHPAFELRDRDGRNVLETGRPVSTLQSCKECHDVQFITQHCYHSSLGFDERRHPGFNRDWRPWDFSPGPFGRWNPLFYRHLSLEGETNVDLDVHGWIAAYARHVGGGPAMLPGDGVEMNCFLCHIPKPDNPARLTELQQGRFSRANTATLATTGVAKPADNGWIYERAAFLPDGKVDAAKLGLCPPSSENCGQCHGVVDRGGHPISLELSLRQWSTATKGQVFSPQRISESAMNIRDKDRLTQAWDIHAERLLKCTSCHFSTNHPAFAERGAASRPSHLKFEPRRLSVGEYLDQPSHQFAKGHTTQGCLARRLDGTMRRCADCHDSSAGHDWLPYREVHFSRLSCEACHIPMAHAPAVRQIDWTLLTASGEPQVQWRGVEGDPNNPTSEICGFRPVLLPSRDLDGRARLVPHNLISAWYWVEKGKSPRPVRLADLKAAMLENGQYHPEIARALGKGPAVLDSAAKVEAVRRRLEAVGVANPAIQAEIQPYSLHHGVGPAKTATSRCETCHSGKSSLGEPIALASYVVNGVRPVPVPDGLVEFRGEQELRGEELVFRPSTVGASLYVLGHDRWWGADLLGAAMLAAVVVGVSLHAGARVWAAHQRKKEDARP